MSFLDSITNNSKRFDNLDNLLKKCHIISIHTPLTNETKGLVNKNFIKKLSQSLYEWTGKRWIISLSKAENLKTFYQEKIDKKEELLNKGKESKIFEEMSKIFPDSSLIDVREEDE